jgi:protein required for attachment to host cells
LDGILAGQVNSQSVEAGKKMNLFKDKGEKITLYIQKEKPKPKTKPKAKTKTKRKSNPKKKPKSKPKSKPKHRG